MAIATDPFQDNLEMVIAGFTTQAGTLVLDPFGKGASVVVAAASSQ